MIDPRAVVDPNTYLAQDVVVGPFSIIGPDVEIAQGTWIGSHVVIQGPTRIGRDNRIYQFTSLGEAAQDKKYSGEKTYLEIGDRNTIREFCTINRGTVQDAGTTRIGDDNWLMAYVHIAHDCQVGNCTVFANGATLGGHVRVDNHAVLGGFALIYQFCRIGAYSLCGFGCGVHKDVPPYVTVAGNRAKPYGINAEGLRRQGFTAQQIRAVKLAYKILYRSDLRLPQTIHQLKKLAETFDGIRALVDFLSVRSKRGIVR